MAMGQNYPSLNKYWEPITKAFNTDNYYEAYELVAKALEYKESTDTLHYLGALASWKLNAYGRADMHLRKLVGFDFETRHPEVGFILAEVLFSTARYNEASNLYKAYLPAVDPASKEYAIAELRIKQVAWAKENQNQKDPLVKIRRLENGINTLDNESSPFVYNNSIYYSSLRKKKDKEVLGPQDFATRIFKVQEIDGKAQKMDSGLIDNNLPMANPCFSKNHELMVFTVCNLIEESTKLNCHIYLKKFSKGKWTKGQKLPEQVNLTNYSSTQASLVEEGEGVYRIYYSSDRPNGVGGFDIWTVLLNEDGSCSSPENLEYINTTGDEYSPFYSEKSKSLFFSSNNHLGFGGFDIYKYSWKGKDSLKVLNLGRSVNSSYDEITYFTISDESISYLASNRPGSTYLDESLQACCYDLYKVVSTPKTVDLLITVKDGFDSLEILGARVSLIDITEKDTIISISEPSDRSTHAFKLIEGRKYKIVANKSIYLGDSVTVSTIDLYNFDTIKRNLFLIQKKTLDVATFEKTTNFNLKGVTVKLLDFDSNQLLDQFTKTDTNEFNFNILKGKNYLLIASKPKYESDTLKITALETSKENSLRRKMFLELSAIAELRRLLPIRLFFDNDIPNPRSEADTTEVLFSKIYDDYVGKKGEYLYKFTNILKGDARMKAVFDIDTFFNKEIKFNGDKFLIFLDKLSIIMEEGHSIDIFLKGFASPRAKSDYNQHLSARRVTSIRNEFDYYNNGVFHPYIRSSNLKIKEIPFGESQASSDVSDSLEDTRNSIYSLKAAYERRVEILEILKGVDDVPKN